MFPHFVAPHVYRFQSWLVLNLISLEIMRLSVYELFSVYSCCPRETRQPGESCTCCVLLSFFLRATGECLGIDFCVCACPAQGKGVEHTGGEPFKPFRVPVLLAAACCSPLVIFSTTVFSHCLTWLTLSPGMVEAKTLLGKLGMCC